MLAAFPAPPVDHEDALAAMLADDKSLRRGRRSVRIRRWLSPTSDMVPVDGPPATFPLLPLRSQAQLCQHLGVSADELDWFADLRGMNAKAIDPRLHHYRYRWVPKATGGHRLLEAPKERLKRIQRWLLRNVLAPIPVSPDAHGFVPGRGLRSFVAPHAGHAVVVRLDIEDFFPSVSRARIVALFRRVGYPRTIARILAGLCTAPTPHQALAAHPRDDADPSRRFTTNQRLRDPHLPQGAPTSPALSNLAAWRLDRRLAAWARGFGATMTRYADDLAFAGGEQFERSLPFFLPRAAAIVMEEGFRVNHRKTRIMRQHRRQHLCGLVVNHHPNVPRRERDNLRALLFNAAKLGPESQNRDGHPDFRRHLEGRISWIRSINPESAARLEALFARISWEAREAGE